MASSPPPIHNISNNSNIKTIPGSMGTVTEGTREDVGSRKLVTAVKGVGSFLLSNWLILGFGLACLLAYLFPNVAARGGIIKSEYTVLYGVIGLIFFINGMQLSPVKIKQHITNWRLHATVQGTSFLVIPVIMLAIVHIVVAAGGVSSGTIDARMLMGMLVLSACPTTIASNIVMTRNSGGDDAAAIIEVVIGNVLGSFIAPVLIYGFIPSHAGFEAWRPASPSTLGPMYANAMKQLGLSVLVPLAVGQAFRWTWSGRVEWVLQTFRLAKLCSLGLVLLIWSTFSSAFKTGAFYIPSKASMIFNILINLALYALFTIVCFGAASPPSWLVEPVNKRVVDSSAARRLPSAIKRVMRVKKMARTEVVAVCFCGAAKTISVGIPLADAMWAEHDDLTKSLVQVPVLLYTTEQVFVAQFLTIFFRWWLERHQNPPTDEEVIVPDKPDAASRGEPVLVRSEDGPAGK